MRYLEELDVGLVLWGDEVTVDHDEVIAFAQRFDPQPMHLSDVAAQAIGLDAVITSGSRRCAECPVDAGQSGTAWRCFQAD